MDEVLSILQQKLRDWRDPRSTDSEWARSVYLGSFVDQLHAVPPVRIPLIAAINPRGPRRVTRSEIHLVAVASFRTRYSIIERLAWILSPVILRTGVIPLIDPWHIAAIDCLDIQHPSIQRLLKHGVLAYSSKNR